MLSELLSELPEHPSLTYPRQHPLAGAPLRAVGVSKTGRAWWPVMGGAEDGDGDGSGDGDGADGDGDGDGDGSGDGAGGDGEYVPPSKEAFADIQRQLARLNANNKRLKEQAKTKAPADPDATTKAKDEGRAEAEDQYKPIVVKAEAKTLLRDMGLKGKPDPILNMLKLADIEVDEDGEVDGLQTQLDKIKRDLPDLFESPKKTAANRVKGDAAANNAGSTGSDDPLVKALRARQGG